MFIDYCAGKMLAILYYQIFPTRQLLQLHPICLLSYTDQNQAASLEETFLKRTYEPVLVIIDILAEVCDFYLMYIVHM